MIDKILELMAKSLGEQEIVSLDWEKEDEDTLTLIITLRRKK